MLIKVSLILSFLFFCFLQPCYGSEIKLSLPILKSNVSLEETLAKRRSIRSFTSDPLTISDLSQLLWAAQGITAKGGKRTSPSAGAIYPLEVFVVAGRVNGLQAGLYRYNPLKNTLSNILKGDLRAKLALAAGMQPCVESAPATFVFVVDYRKMLRYRDKGRTFADFEVGHAAENLMLQAVALKLGTVAVGAFDHETVKTLLGLALSPVYLVPAGHPK